MRLTCRQDIQGIAHYVLGEAENLEFVEALARMSRIYDPMVLNLRDVSPDRNAAPRNGPGTPSWRRLVVNRTGRTETRGPIAKTNPAGRVAQSKFSHSGSRFIDSAKKVRRIVMGRGYSDCQSAASRPSALGVPSQPKTG